MVGAVGGVSGQPVDQVFGKSLSMMAETALSELGVDPSECLIIGDRFKTDMKMGTRVDMQTVLVMSGVTNRAALPEADVAPDHMLDLSLTSRPFSSDLTDPSESPTEITILTDHNQLMRIRSLLTGRGHSSEPSGYDPKRARTTVTRHRMITHEQRRYDCRVVEPVDSSYAVGYGYDSTSDSSRVFLLDEGETVCSVSSARPVDADIAADGTAVVVESGSDADLTSRVRILDTRGETKMENKIDATVGTSGISVDGNRVVAVSKARSPRAHIYDVADTEATTTELYMSGLVFDSFQVGDKQRQICLSDGSRPHLILTASGDTVWESSTYRSMRPKLDQVRDWLSR